MTGTGADPDEGDRPRWLDRTRQSYDTVAEDYTVMLEDLLESDPYEHIPLDLLARLVRDAGGGPVLDVGCGSGRTTRFLAAAGLEVRGVDLSPGMVARARLDHPALRFDVASMTDLELAPGSLTAVLLWYSLIHVPDELVPPVLDRLVRALRPGGLVLVGFHVGDRVTRKRSGYGGHPMDVDVHLRPVERVVGYLEDAGLHVGWRSTHVPEPDATPQGALLGWLPA